MNNICNICGANYVYRNGKWVCPACDNIKQEEITNEEVVLLTNASTKLRMADFDDAEELYRDCIKKYPNNAEAYWGLLLSRYGIKYEEDLDGKKVPTVYATSIESILDDKDYKKALSLADKDTEKYYKQQAQKFESIRKEWVDKASKEPPFDIFICFKDSDAEKDISRTDDSYEAQNLYTYLMSKGYSVFFSRESLRDKVAERYEPYIFNALNTAHVMIIYSSSKEYLESTWVKNEWSRFLKKIKNKQKQENSLILAYEKMKPSEFPKEFNSVQCMDASQKTFYSDLEKHIDKVINKAKAPVSKIERVDIKENIRHKKKTINEQVETREIGTYQVEQLSGDEETQVKTAYKFLEKNLYTDALEIFERILDKNEKNGQAILGRTLARLEVPNVQQMINANISEDKFEDIELAISYSKKADALNIISQLKDTCLTQFKKNNLEFAKNLMQFILQYKSDNDEFFDDIRNIIISLVDNREKEFAVEIFDFFLKYRSVSTDMYLQELKSFISLLMRNYYYKTAVTYYDKYVEIFPNDTEMLWKGILIHINCPSDDQLSRKIVNFKHFDKFEALLATLSKGTKRNLYVNKIINATIDAGKNNDDDDIETLANIFENTLKYTESNKDITEYIFEFAKVCQSREKFDLAEKYYALLIGEDEHNHKAYWGLLQSKLKASNNTELIQQPVIITTLPEFHSAIVAAGDDDKSVDRYIELKAKQISYLENQKIREEKRRIRRRKIGIFSSIVAIIVAIITGFSGWKMYYNANNTLLYTLNSSGTGYIVSAGKYYNEKSITIPRYYNGKLVTEIAANAFKDKDLEYVSIPNTVEKIGNNAFYNCDNLKNINLNISESKENSNLNDGVVIKFRYPLDNYTIIKDYHETEMQRNEILNQWEIHRGIDFASSNNYLVKAVYDGVVTSIYNNVTDGYVVEITHNNNLKTRYMSLAKTPESYVYEGATVLQGATIGRTSNTKKDSYNSTGYIHFEVELDGKKVNPHDYFVSDNNVQQNSSTNSQTVTYENKLATIGEYAFYNCSSLEEFKTCDTITTIGPFAFANCSRLESFELPSELKRIESGTFQGAFGYKDTTISLHDNIEFIGSNAFNNCSKLVKIEVSERDAIPESWDSNWKGKTEAVVEWTMNITFDYQGATANNTVTKTSVTTGKPYQLPVPTKEGYIFDGWYSDRNGEGTKYSYANGYSINNWSEDSSIKVYANWIANNNSIIFNGNSATSGEMENFVIPSGESKKLPANKFVRDGYTFAGWATTSNGEVVYGDCDDYVMGINPTNVLYAIWTANTNELSFNGNGPNMGNGMIWGSMDDISVKTDETITLPANTFIKNGYRFAGWATTPSGNVVYLDRSQYTMGTSLSATLYAKWQPIDYTITLVLNGGSYDGETVITYNAESEPFTIQEATREGYTFNGWTRPDSGGAPKTITIQKGTIYNKTFTASWRPNTNEIIFNGNGATSGTMSNQKIRTGETKALNSCTFERDEYVFAGWATSTNGSAEYPDNANYTMGTNSTYTLYATWKRNVFYISNVEELIKINDNSNNNINDKYVLMNDINLNGQEWTPIATFENPFDDEFDGQGYCISNFIIASNKNQKGFFAAIEDATIINLKLDTITLQNNSQDYAVCGGLVAYANNSTISNCSVVNSSISFSASRGVYSGGIVGQALSTNILNCCVLSGGVSAISYLRGPFYNYAGGISGSGGTIENCFTTCSVTAYAHENNSLTDRNKNYAGGIVGANAIIKKSYATGNVSATGYNNSTIYSGSMDYAGAVAGNTDCTATNCYGFTGQTITGDYIITPDTTAEISISSMSTIWNYVKNNWSSDIWVLSNNANPVLKTNREYYSITYNLNGGINSTSNLAAYHSNEKVLLGNPTRDGYTFDAWFTTEDFQEDTEITTIEKGSTGDINLYAKWIPNTNEIIFDGNGATAGSMSNQQGLTASTITLNSNQFTRDWYHFIGWSTTPNGEIEYVDGDSYLMGINATNTLYAVWEDNVKEIYTIDDLNSINDIIDNELYYTYELKNNLTLDDSWVEIGEFPGHPFIGCFNGNNYTITLNLTGDELKGVFDYNKGIIQDLVVNNAIDVTHSNHSGSVVYYNAENAVVQNCVAEGFIIINSAIDYNTNGGIVLGGIVGSNSGGIVENCMSMCDITVSFASGTFICGGVIGTSSLNAINRKLCYNGTIDCRTSDASSNSIENDMIIGGIMGKLHNGTIDDAFVCGNVWMQSYMQSVSCGGIVGSVGYKNALISYCYSDAYIVAASSFGCAYAGGIVGNATDLITISNCVILGDIYASVSVAGNGSAYSATIVEDRQYQKYTIKNCYVVEGQQTKGSPENSTDYPQIQGESKTKEEILLYIQENWDFEVWTTFDNYYPLLKNSSRIIYEGNGSASGEMLSEIYYNKNKINLTSLGYEKPGYDFLGWATSPNGEVLYEDGAEFELQPNKTYILYARWELVFTYEGNYITGLTEYGKTLEEIYIPSEVDGQSCTYIKERAFENCENLVKITIDQFVTRIEKQAFKGCTNLKYADFGNDAWWQWGSYYSYSNISLSVLGDEEQAANLLLTQALECEMYLR